MRSYRVLALLVVIVSGAVAADVGWVPDGLPPVPTAKNVGLGNYLKPEQGKAILDAALTRFPPNALHDAASIARVLRGLQN